jgi:hypothetical protein
LFVIANKVLFTTYLSIRFQWLASYYHQKINTVFALPLYSVTIRNTICFKNSSVSLLISENIPQNFTNSTIRSTNVTPCWYRPTDRPTDRPTNHPSIHPSTYLSI